MQIQENISLKDYNTFGIDVKARFFSSFHTLDELEEHTEYTAKNKSASGLLILGGGSNILFTKDYDGTVLKNEISGIEELHEDDEYVFVKCGAGENWHRFVQHCIKPQLGRCRKSLFNTGQYRRIAHAKHRRIRC